MLHRPFTYLGRETLERKHPFLRKAVEIQQQEELSFDWKGAKIYVDLDESIMTGQHSIVGRIAGGQPKIFEHLENDELIFKTFRDHCIMLVDGGEKIGNNAAATIIQEYEAVKRALNRSRFGVADLHNIKQVAEDCGYFLFEYVPHSLIDPLSSVEGNKRLSRQELNVMRDIERLTSHIWNEDDSEPPMNQHDRLLLQTLRKLSPYIALKGAPLIELSSEEKKLLITFRRLAPALWPATKTPLATASEEQRNTLLATHRIAPYIWEKREGTLIRDLAPLQQRLLTDLCELFQCTYFSGTTPDLRPDNLRYRADGTLTLIDFRENPVDTDDRDIFYDEMIASFNCSKGDQIYNTIKGSMMTGISGNVSSSSFSQ